MGKLSYDTNVLLYAEGLRRVDSDEAKIRVANELVADLAGSDGTLVLAAQVLAELHHGLTRLLRLDRAEANGRVFRWLNLATIGPTSAAVLETAMVLSEMHNLQTYDSIIVAACAEENCEILYSEDLQHDFEWRGLRVVNPFA